MARTYKQKSIVSGMSVKDVLNMDINVFSSLNLSDMRKVVGRLVSAGNKRIRTFEKAGEDSPALRYINKSGGKFSTKGKNLNELRREYARAKGFFESKTSNIKDWKKVKNETVKSLEKEGIGLITISDFDKFWRSYEKLKEMSPNVASKSMKYNALKEISTLIDTKPEMSIDDIATKLTEQMDKLYEESEGKTNIKSPSDFFELE